MSDPVSSAAPLDVNTGHPHTVAFRLESGWGLRADVKCAAEPGAVCRTVCRHSACEEGCVEPETHVREPIDYCNVLAWLDGSGGSIEECYDGSDTIPVHDGPIRVWWDAPDEISWAYVEDVEEVEKSA